VPNSDSEQDKRQFPRAPIELKVEYRRLNTFFADYTKNISRGGTFIKTAKPLNIGTDFIFKLFVPTLNEPIELAGVVQWVIRPGEEGEGEQPGMGIQFKYESIHQRDEIESTVEKLMIDSLGRHIYDKLQRRHNEE
jgi:type IV pilus assembly protein PilZ